MLERKSASINSPLLETVVKERVQVSASALLKKSRSRRQDPPDAITRECEKAERMAVKKAKSEKKVPKVSNKRIKYTINVK